MFPFVERQVGTRRVGATAALAVLLSGGLRLEGAPAAARILNGTREGGGSLAGHGAGDDPACKPVFEASDRLLTTPNHMFMTQNGADGKPRNSEAIFADGARYVMVAGKWSRSPVSVQQTRQQEQENRKNAKSYSCRYVRDEAVNGEAAALYSMQTESEFARAESKVWISKGKGFVLREEIDLDTGDAGARDRDHMSIRYEYGNVHAPQV